MAPINRQKKESLEKPATRRSAGGFTLVELLVSMAVLVLMVGLLSQLVDSARLSISGSGKRISADRDARLFLDRLTGDLRQMVIRGDVSYLFAKNQQNGDDAMFFYSEAPAAATGTASLGTVALIGYRMNRNNPYYPGHPVLERIGQALTWDGPSSSPAPGGMAFLLASGAEPTLAQNWSSLIGGPPYTSGTSGVSAHIMSSQIFRMEICFILKNGTFSVGGQSFTNTIQGYSNTPTGAPAKASGPITPSYFTDGNVFGFPPDLAGIVVTVAVLDDQTRNLLTGAQIDAIAAKLPDALSASTALPGSPVLEPLPAEVWQAALNQPSNFSGIPPVALSRVRIYQRTIFFDHP